MKKAKADELRPEYLREDLGPGVRGKYHADYAAGRKFVLLDADVAEAFPTDEAVNEALRSLVAIARRTAHPHESPGAVPADA